MAFTQEELRKAIKDILKDADLDNLSAKKVRLSLEETYKKDLSKQKKEIDELLMELISESQDSQGNGHSESSEDEIEDEPPQKKKKPTLTATVTKPKPKPKPKKTPETVNETNDDSDMSEDDNDEDDETMAQKLQDELNSTGRRTRSRNAPKKKERKPPVKRERKGGSGYSRPCLLSHELAEVMGVDKLARNEVVKKIWQIVRERNLQDPSNKQFMICDDQLLPIFGKKKVRTFGMMKYLKKHIKDAKDVAS